MTRRTGRWIWTAVATLCGIGFNFIVPYPIPLQAEPPTIGALERYHFGGGDGLENPTMVENNFFYFVEDPKGNSKMDAITLGAIDKELTGRGFARSESLGNTVYVNSNGWLLSRKQVVRISSDGKVFCLGARSKWPFIGLVAIAFGSITYFLLGRLKNPKTITARSSRTGRSIDD